MAANQVKKGDSTEGSRWQEESITNAISCLAPHPKEQYASMKMNH